MAVNQTRRLSNVELETDFDALLAIRELNDYKPLNPAFNKTRLDELDQEYTLADQEERRLQNLLAAARDRAVAASWARHNAILGAKQQIIAQYGDDSSEVQSLGLKKKSERKRPVRRGTANTLTT